MDEKKKAELIGKVTVRVDRDEDAESPRGDCNTGIMACWHSRYTLGDVQPKEDPETWLEANAPEGSVVLPLFLMDHGGISMSTGSFEDPWDSGQVGVIVATPESTKESWPDMKWPLNAEDQALIERALRSEVKVYDDFIRGNAWGFSVDTDEGTSELDSSCWGFIGDEDDTLEAMKEHVDERLHDALTKAWENRGYKGVNVTFGQEAKAAFQAAARQEYASDEIQIDKDADVRTAEPGVAWVQAWVRVDTNTNEEA